MKQPRDTRMAEKRDELQGDLQAVVERVLLEHDIPPAAAAIATNAVQNRLAEYWAGQSVSFPTHARRKLHKLELEIWDNFRGRNFDELARRYGMSERGIRILIARVRARISEGRADAQRDLLSPDEPS